MRRVVAVALCVLFPVSALAASNSDNSYKVIYDGGSIQGTKAGDTDRLVIDSKQIKIVSGKGRDEKEIATIPADAVTEISYGEDVHRRVGTAIGLAVISLGVGALMALSKSKKHYVGLTWATADSKGGFAMQCDKSDYRGVLAALEGITGKKAVNSDSMTVKN